jgi:hypothetical protein
MRSGAALVDAAPADAETAGPSGRGVDGLSDGAGRLRVGAAGGHGLPLGGEGGAFSGTRHSRRARRAGRRLALEAARLERRIAELRRATGGDSPKDGNGSSDRGGGSRLLDFEEGPAAAGPALVELRQGALLRLAKTRERLQEGHLQDAGRGEASQAPTLPFLLACRRITLNT